MTVVCVWCLLLLAVAVLWTKGPVPFVRFSVARCAPISARAGNRCVVVRAPLLRWRRRVTGAFSRHVACSWRDEVCRVYTAPSSLGKGGYSATAVLLRVVANYFFLWCNGRSGVAVARSGCATCRILPADRDAAVCVVTTFFNMYCSVGAGVTNATPVQTKNVPSAGVARGATFDDALTKHCPADTLSGP